MDANQVIHPAGIKTGLRSEEHLSRQQAYWQQRETGVAEASVSDSLVDPPSAWANRAPDKPLPLKITEQVGPLILFSTRSNLPKRTMMMIEIT